MGGARRASGAKRCEAEQWAVSEKMGIEWTPLPAGDWEIVRACVCEREERERGNECVGNIEAEFTTNE